MTIQEAFAEQEELRAKVHDLADFIKAAQKICKHTMIYDGHDSHYNWYICSICRFRNYE